MTKQLPTNNIANELSGSSVFFQPQASAKPVPKISEIESKPTPTTQTVEVTPSPKTPASQSSNRGVMPSRHRDNTQARRPDKRQPLNEEGMMAEHFDEIRKTVKQLGKDVSTHRLRLQRKPHWPILSIPIRGKAYVRAKMRSRASASIGCCLITDKMATIVCWHSCLNDCMVDVMLSRIQAAMRA